MSTLIQRTNKGSSKSKTSGTTLSVASVSIAAHASIVVCLAHDPVSVTSVVWNSNSLTKVVEETNTSHVQGSIWVLHDCTTGTGNVDVTFGSAITAKAMTVTQLLGDTGANNGILNHDKFSSGQGSGTAPSSSATATLTYGGEYAVGALCWEAELTNDNGPSRSFTFSGQVEITSGGASDTNIAIVEYFFQQDDSTGALTCSTSGAAPSAQWVGLVVTFFRDSPQVRDDQQFRSWYWELDHVQVDQEFRSWHYKKDRVQVAQQFRTFWYVEAIASDDSFVGII